MPGDVVRIAPNELVFFSQQAFHDIYGTQVHGLEAFVKTDLNRRGEESGGIAFEEDPVRHRQLAKQLAPAFSNRSLKTMEPTIHEHVDLFVQKMRTKGSCAEGVSLVDWTNWLTMDIAADLAYCNKMRQLEEGKPGWASRHTMTHFRVIDISYFPEKNSLYLQMLLDFNAFAPVIWVFRRFPLISPLRNLFLPWSKMLTYTEFRKRSEAELRQRIERRGATDHLDYFEQLLPSGGDAPANPREMAGLGVAARQLMVAGYQPVSELLYATLFYLAHESAAYAALVAEIRGAFRRYEDITPDALASLPYLNACLEEGLRLFPGNNSGMPRISPGATVDGTYVPKGVRLKFSVPLSVFNTLPARTSRSQLTRLTVIPVFRKVYIQTSFFATGRASRYFHEGKRFRPQRFLPPDHKLYDPRFADDACDGLSPFSLGPRACSGKTVAWIECRLVIAKLLWSLEMVKVPGQHVDLERDLKTYGFWVKAEIKMRFVAVDRAQT